jgi:hypothetical protein
VLRPDGSLRPTRELAMSLDDWGGSTFLADVVCEAAQKMEREKFLEILEPTEDEDVHIPVGAVLTPEGEPYPKVEMVRRIQALEGEE